VRLESLSTSNGPAVRIWLSAARAGASDDAVAAADHLDLGGLKANHGNQNYEIHSARSLEKFRSVVVWCRRFDVVFGSAPIG
jgi:predicted HD phosphohydrolase